MVSDTHADVHVAAAVDHNGGLLGVESFPADQAGYESLIGWLAGFGPISRIGVEGTGSWGVGLARLLGDHDIEVIEVDRPNRQTPVDRESRTRLMPSRRPGLLFQGRRR